jgi:hypothetical protein
MTKKYVSLVVLAAVFALNGSNNKNNGPRQTYNPNKYVLNTGSFNVVAQGSKHMSSTIRCNSCGQSFPDYLFHSCPVPKGPNKK